MKKRLFLILILFNTLFAGDIIVKGYVQVASIVGFNQASVEGTSYTNATNTFLNSDPIEVDVAFGDKFTVKKDLYVKSNTVGDLEILLTANTLFGYLFDGSDILMVEYKMMNQVVDMKSPTWITIPTTVNSVNTLTDGFQIIQRTATANDQRAGTYETTLTFNVRAQL